MSELTHQHESRWPHRLAWAVVATTFPLIWVGGLVTTYEAGMAVPDWPNTYGYNLFLYPWQTWLVGPWDLFIEHGHRLLGATVGFLTIGLAVSLWFGKLDGIPRWLGWVALAAVIGQGALGGMRVLFDERQLAKIHACTGPAFFALAVGLLVATARSWRSGVVRTPHRSASSLQSSATMVALLSYLQLVLGAQLRHISVTATPGVFRTFLVFHLAVAGLLLVMAILLAGRSWLQFRAFPKLCWLATGLLAAIACQLALGSGTWLVNYAWPWPSVAPAWLAAYTIVAHGQLQSLVTTGHVALGSLIVGTSVALALWSWRLVSMPVEQSADRNTPALVIVRPEAQDRRMDHAELVGLALATAGRASVAPA